VAADFAFHILDPGVRNDDQLRNQFAEAQKILAILMYEFQRVFRLPRKRCRG
jgi:hypothetical protein